MKYTLLLTSIMIIFGAFSGSAYADIFGGIDTSQIGNASIVVDTSVGDDITTISRDFGFKILTAFRLVISGFALIYLVLIGAYMIVNSENEERIKSQKNQITYSLVGFLFLNIP